MTDSTNENVTLDDLRQAINQLDEQLLAIFSKRRQLSLDVAENKFRQNREVRDEAQEKNLLSHLIEKGESLGIAPSTTLSLFHNIIEDSVRCQYDYFLEKDDAAGAASVALLGEAESFSHIAAQNHFASKQQQLETLFSETFEDVFHRVTSGEARFGLVPIENTTAGNIVKVYDHLISSKLQIIGEEKLKVKHCLIGTESSSLESVTDVYSHPQAIAQCNQFFLDNPQVSSHFRSSTSSALRLVSEYQNPKIAAIASELAAKHFGLKILKHTLNNYQENYTRFVLIAQQRRNVPDNIPAKTSIVLHTGQQAGSLFSCLEVLKNHDIALTKLHSRPIPTQPWQEMFYIDFEGNLNHAKVQMAMAELTSMSPELRILGCYPKHDIIATKLDSQTISHA